MSSHRDRKLELALKHELRAAGTPDGGACVDAETLGAWADGGLNAAQMGSVELHVASCARCQAIVGATARSAPAPAVNEASAGFSLWKWWLAPIAAGAAAVTLWMVVPQETMQGPPAPARVIESKQGAPAELPAKEALTDDSRTRADAPAPGREDRAARREPPLERKSENSLAEQVAIGAVAATPPAAAVAAPSVAEADSQRRARVAGPIEIVSPDPSRRWRVNGASIERSEDSGASWLAVHQIPGDTITGGIAPAGSICWLIGANGVVLMTADGTTFARVPILERVALTGITATDARSATVTAADGRRFRTDDSGRTWRQS